MVSRGAVDLRWMVTGAAGLLGQDVVARLAGAPVRALTRSDLDITDAAAIEQAVAGMDVVVNCAAWTAVDAAETHEAEAFTLNAVAPQLLARATHRAGARLVHISTDYVFDGQAQAPYGEDHPLRPASAYGRTKAAGEWAVRAVSAGHLVVRTAWLYGAGGPCFPTTMARLATERPTLAVVADQMGQPTWSADLADLIVRLVEARAPAGTYHGTASGQVSWHGFTQEIIAAMGKDPAMVTETTSGAFARPAPRPAYSVLAHDALLAAGVDPIGPWQDRWTVAAPTVLGHERMAGAQSSRPSR